jgi:hypothetical protein
VALLASLHVLLVRAAAALLASLHMLLVRAAAGRALVFTGLGVAGVFVALLASLHVLFVASALRSGHEILLFLRFERTFRWFINRPAMAWFRQEAIIRQVLEPADPDPKKVQAKGFPEIFWERGNLVTP